MNRIAETYAYDLVKSQHEDQTCIENNKRTRKRIRLTVTNPKIIY